MASICHSLWVEEKSNVRQDGPHDRNVQSSLLKMAPKILIVDDEALMHLLYKNHIERAGYQLLAARTAREGLAVARAEQPAVIVVDVILAGPDGLALLRELKDDEKTKNIPVIIFTATISQAYEATRKESSTSGAAAFLTKPISPDRLVSEIRRFVPGGAGDGEPVPTD
jgi:CheY-like chemotaxis protein